MTELYRGLNQPTNVHDSLVLSYINDWVDVSAESEDGRMLKGISPYLSPDLLKILYEMGHGDELLLADAHFPGHTLGRRVLRADGIHISQLLHAILPLFELEPSEDALAMMQPDGGDPMNSDVEADFLAAIRKHSARSQPVTRIGREAFYERAKAAYVVVMTGEIRAYGNLILKKGVTPIASS
jgi:L-fucose mutarotase